MKIISVFQTEHKWTNGHTAIYINLQFMILNSENESIPAKKKFSNIFQLYFKNKILLLCVLVFTSKPLTAEESLPQLILTRQNMLWEASVNK